MPPTLPPCCTPTPDASLAEELYCIYNAAGDPETAGRNFRGEPCPVFADLPANVRAKWEAVAANVDVLPRDAVWMCRLSGVGSPG